MTTRIFKYPLAITREQTLQIPQRAKILCVQLQGDIGLSLWAQVDDAEPVEAREIRVYGTGHEIAAPGTLAYVGTVLQGPYVWHVYETL